MTMLKIAPGNGNHVGSDRADSVHPGALSGESPRSSQLLALIHQEVRSVREEVEAIRKDMLLLQQSSLRARWKRFLSPRLNAAPHHLPIPLNVPRRYNHLPKLPTPPTIALVTPAYNQGHFLERTLRRVLDQS